MYPNSYDKIKELMESVSLQNTTLQSRQSSFHEITRRLKLNTLEDLILSPIEKIGVDDVDYVLQKCLKTKNSNLKSLVNEVNKILQTHSPYVEGLDDDLKLTYFFKVVKIDEFIQNYINKNYKITTL